VCDDSRVFSTALQKYLEYDPAIKVTATFPDADRLLAAVETLDIDLITMDLEMPGLDPVKAIPQILAQRPVPIVLLSAHAVKESERAAAAMGAGALDAIAKSRLALTEPDTVWAAALRSRFKRLGSVRLKRPADTAPARRARPARPGFPRRAGIIGIGTSTGGPQALATLLAVLPQRFPIPVLVVQHIAPGFIEPMTKWIDARTAVPVGLAHDGQAVGPGIWFAPDDRHLTVDRSMRVALRSGATPARAGEPAVGAVHRPSVDVLFSSLADAAGAEVVAVVLTGMGRDGAEGVRAVRSAGGFVVAQDQQSSVVFGMPKAASEAGANAVLSLEEIGSALGSLRPPEPSS